MKTFQIAFAVATTAALCSAQSPWIKPGAKYTARELAAMAPPTINLPGAPLVGGSDNCATPDAITGIGNFAFDNTLATDSSPAIPSACAVPVHDVWFVWTAPSTGTVTMTLCGHTTADTAIAIYTGNTCPTATSIGCNDDSACGAASTATFLANAGQQYMLRVGMFSGNPGIASSFDLSIAATPPPANDGCSTPTSISGVGNFLANMASATSSGIIPSCLFGAPDADVWYNWTAPATGTATVTLCSHTTSDTVLAVYNGTACPSSGTSTACNDDFCGFASSSQVSLPVIAGTHYLIQVGMFQGTAGVNTSFDITMPPPSNDACATPINLSGPGTFPFDTTLATTGSEGQTEALCNLSGTTAVRKDLWYTYTAATNGTATVSTCGMITGGNSSDTKIAAYLGNGCPTSASIGCSDDSPCATGSTLATILTFPVTCGTQYTIQLGQFSATANISGTFSLSEAGSACLTPPTEICFGTAATCPCGNAGAANNGCANSSNAAGAHLSATGTNSISADTLVLTGTGMPNTSTALYYQGSTLVANVFGDGINCAGAPQVRLGNKTNVAGTSSYPGAGDPSVSVKGGAVAGSNLIYQIAYRDAANFCTPSTFNASNAVQVTWAP
jgi:hypothetical protein